MQNIVGFLLVLYALVAVTPTTGRHLQFQPGNRLLTASGVSERSPDRVPSTNAERFAEGLPPLRPSRLYDPASRTGAIAPRQSSPTLIATGHIQLVDTDSNIYYFLHDQTWNLYSDGLLVAPGPIGTFYAALDSSLVNGDVGPSGNSYATVLPYVGMAGESSRTQFHVWHIESGSILGATWSNVRSGTTYETSTFYLVPRIGTTTVTSGDDVGEEGDYITMAGSEAVVAGAYAGMVDTIYQVQMLLVP